MHAVSSPHRPQGAITYYGCKDEECPETSYIPVPRMEIYDPATGKLKPGGNRIEELNVAARDDMEGVG